MTNDRTLNTKHRPDHVRVVVVDDHRGYRSLVAEVIEATPGFGIQGTAGSWADARQLMSSDSPPDLVLMDVNLGEESGVVAAAELVETWPDIRVVLISTMDAADLPPESAKASGFLPKSQLSPSTIEAAWRGLYDWGQ